MNKKMRSSLDLTSPKKPGEKVYTQVQMTRIINYVTFKALRSLRNTIRVMTGIVLAALLVYIAVQHGQNNKLTKAVDRIDGILENQCTQARESRENLKTLVEVAVGDTDGDGKPDVDPPDYRRLLETPQYNDLSPEDKDMWNLVLGGLSAGQDNPNQGTTTERLLDYRATLIAEPPATCTEVVAKG